MTKGDIEEGQIKSIETGMGKEDGGLLLAMAVYLLKGYTRKKFENA